MTTVQNEFDYSFDLMQDILISIGRINNLLRVHQEQGNSHSLTAESWRKKKQQLIQQLVELLQEFNLEVSIQAKAA
jgi:hypothetical protein